MIPFYGIMGCVAAMIVALRWLGRPWWCRCGELAPWPAVSSCQSQHLFGPWSLTHMGHGLVMYGVARAAFPSGETVSLLFAVVALECLWEVVENTGPVVRLFRQAGDKEYHGDSVANSIGDVASCFGAAWLLSFLL